MNINQDTTLTNQDSDKDMMGGIKVDDLEKMAKDGYPRPALSLAYGQGLIVGINRAKEKFKAAHKASEQRIQELEGKVSKLECLEHDDELIVETITTLRHTVTELTASNNQLRGCIENALSCVSEEINPRNYNGEILTKFINDYGDMVDILQKALSSTPTQSLALHENEVIERCAKVIDKMVNIYTNNCTKYKENNDSESVERNVNKGRAAMSCAESIRALKVTP